MAEGPLGGTLPHYSRRPEVMLRRCRVAPACEGGGRGGDHPRREILEFEVIYALKPPKFILRATGRVRQWSAVYVRVLATWPNSHPCFTGPPPPPRRSRK